MRAAAVSAAKAFKKFKKNDRGKQTAEEKETYGWGGV
jgi:hypothetical protein